MAWLAVTLPGLLPRPLLSASDGLNSDIAYTRVTSFGFNSDGWTLNSALLGDSNGVFFGTAYRGGEANRGTVFRINQDGSGFQVLHHFRGAPMDGNAPLAEVSFGPDGWLYGTTEFGGTNDTGTIFKLRPDGSGHRLLYHFPAPPGHRRPHGHLELCRNGAFLGTAQVTGNIQQGAIFTILPDGSGFRILHEFGITPGDGADPDNGLTLGSDGVLYGSCSIGGGPGMNGTLFRINEDGTGYTIVYRFPFDDAPGEPKGRLAEADGVIYGNATGLIYKINTDGSGFTHLYTNQFGVTGYGGVIPGTDGALYWSALAANQALVFSVGPDGSNPRRVASFPLQPVPEGSSTGIAGIPTYGIARGTNATILATLPTGIFRVREDGSDPVVLRHLQHTTYSPSQPGTTLLRGSDALFYGTSESGGFSNAGTIFLLNANGTVHRPIFQFGRTTNTANTPNRLLEASDGFLYGTTQFGGAGNSGVIFRIGKDGSGYGILKHLGELNAPRLPASGLIEGRDGWLYGLSTAGGITARGTIFKIQKDGTGLTVLRSFSTAEGYSPAGELVQGPDGMLYGVTTAGAASNFGMVFRIHPDGSDFARLHQFTGGPDGQRPRAGLILDTDGNLFGTTSGGGTTVPGTVFRIRTDGSAYQVLHNFLSPDQGMGRIPRAPLVDGGDAFLYGTTSAGGIATKGTVFRIRKDGTQFRTLWHFPAFEADGDTPSGGLTSVGDGSYLGVTSIGGHYAKGAVFRIDPIPVRLAITNAPPIEVSWPTSSTSDQLEHATTLGSGIWQPVPWQAVSEGTIFRSTISADPQSLFFRLRREWK